MNSLINLLFDLINNLMKRNILINLFIIYYLLSFYCIFINLLEII